MSGVYPARVRGELIVAKEKERAKKFLPVKVREICDSRNQVERGEIDNYEREYAEDATKVEAAQIDAPMQFPLPISRAVMM
jgi:hypothetical protein